MTFLKSLQKNIKSHHFIALLGVLVLGLAIMQYSGRKTNYSDGLTGAQGSGAQQQQQMQQPQQQQGGVTGAVDGVNSVGQNETYATVPAGSMTNTNGLAPTPRQECNYDPSELLPKDVNSQWAQLNPAGNADFKNVNLLKAGYLIGIDTVGSTLRNANLQERSEPPNPTASVSPWLNTTIEPDLMRLPLEIGTRSCAQ